MANLIAKEAPDFTAWAVMEDNEINTEFKLSSYKGKYVILFFYPLDFTYVCPTEILAFNEKLEEFKKRDAEVIGVSIDSVHTHRAWKRTPLEKGGIGPIKYPLVSDLTRSIGRAYDVLLDDAVAVRALFLIDREGIIKHVTLNEDALGRNINETLRTLDALRHYDKHGKVCPANWEEGGESLDRSTESVVDYLSKFAKKE
jgi:peroxiredoxin (alkyl hydroperoxide reductase subunit C)